VIYYKYRKDDTSRGGKMETRKVNVMFQKGGSGSVSTRVALPKSWIDKMGITPDQREVTIEFNGERIEVRKMNVKEKLYERIDREIERKMMKTGVMGTESVSVTLDVSEEEMGIIRNEEHKYDSKNYWWEIDEDNLTISYTEEV